MHKGFKRNLHAISWKSAHEKCRNNLAKVRHEKILSHGQNVHVLWSKLRVKPLAHHHHPHPILRCSLDLEVSMESGGLAAGTSARQPRARTTAIPRPVSESPFGRKPKEDKQEKWGKIDLGKIDNLTMLFTATMNRSGTSAPKPAHT